MPLSNQHILIVEDEFLIGFDLAETVRDAGAKVSGPATTVKEALELLECEQISFVILDINLGDELSNEIARKLFREQIPFVYHTGQTGILESARWPNAPVLSKPASPSNLIETIVGLLEKQLKKECIMPTPDLTVYHMKGSRSLRVTWLLEELGLPYVVELIGFDPGNAGGDEYRKIHPLNKVPALIDGKTTMFESVAIMQFVMNKYGDGGLRPDINDSDYGPYLQWLHYGESTLAPIIVTLMQQRNFFPKEQQSKFVEAQAEAELVKQLAFLEDQLSDHPYLLERGFSAADISIGYSLLLLRFAKAKDLLSERLQTYWKTLTERDAWVDASH